MSGALKGSAQHSSELTNDLRKSSISFSRYRLLDDEEQRQESEAIARIIRDIKIQRRSSGAKQHLSTDVRGSSDSRPSSVGPSWTRCGTAVDTSLELARRFETCTSPTKRTKPLSDSKQQPDDHPDSFQVQVLNELRRLKEAQRQDLAAIEQLRREKHEAEEKARRLAKKLEHDEVRPPSFMKKKARELVLDERYNELGNLHEAHESNNAMHSNMLGQDQAGDENVPQWAELSGDEADFVDDDDLPPRYDGHDAGEPIYSLDSPRWSVHSDSPPPRIFEQRDKTGVITLAKSRSPKFGLTRDEYLTQPHGRHAPMGPTQKQPRGCSNSIDLAASHRSCTFFEEKERRRLEEEHRKREAAERIARAAKATPPKRLLEHQETARQKKLEKLRALQREMNAELAKEKRAKAREVPLTTYLPSSMASQATEIVVDAETQRVERIRKRSQELLQSSMLPPRMAAATTSPTCQSEPPRMSIKMKKKLLEEAEREAEKRRRRPKAVPDFDRLHRNWERVLAQKRSKQIGMDEGDDGEHGPKSNGAKTTTECKEFFKSRADKLEELRAKKEARRMKLLAEEQNRLRKEKETQEKLLRRIKKESASILTGGSSNKVPVTKTEQLRIQKLLADAAKAERQRRCEQLEAEAREKKLRDASRRVAAQVRQSEARRRDEYSGTFVELPADQVNEKAKESREQFREAMKRNREKILAAVALKPSLMERFTTDVKREEHKRAALEAVVSNVFKGDKSAMKGVLTDEEQALAEDLVAGTGDEKGEDE